MTWRQRVELRVEAGQRGVAAGNMVWDTSHWDSGTWSGLEPNFVPLSGAEIEGLATNRGREKAYSRMSAGTAELQLVWRDVADRWGMRSTSPIQLGQEVRVMARVLGTTHQRGELGAPETDYFPIYRGTVRSIVDQWNAGTNEFRLICRLIDRLADLGAVDLPEQPLAGLGDTTDQRLLRILDMAGIDASFALLDPATVQHSSSNFARNLLDEAQVTAESDAGSSFYVDRAGLIRLLAAKAWDDATKPRSHTAQMLWANAAGGTEPVGPTDFGTGADLDDVRNAISAARSGGTAVTYEDTDSQIKFGKRTNQRYDLTCRYDADAAAWAQLWLSELSQKTERIDAVTGEINPDADTARIADLIDIELLDAQQIKWRDGIGELTGLFHVQGVKHRITAKSWRVTVNLWAYAGHGFQPVAASLWESAHWQTDVWSS
jgi:hypothetical protein